MVVDIRAGFIHFSQTTSHNFSALVGVNFASYGPLSDAGGDLDTSLTASSATVRQREIGHAVPNVRLHDGHFALRNPRSPFLAHSMDKSVSLATRGRSGASTAVHGD